VNSNQILSLRQIALFWLPLAATWLMMSIEGPYLAAIIGRLPDQTYNLAAYGVAFSLALIIESPIIMLLSASTSLVTHYANFRKLFFFTLILNGAITAIMFVLLIPSAFDVLISDILKLPEAIHHRVYLATWILLPWPAAIGFRRFYQGVLIRSGFTRRVAYGTVMRLLFMSLTAFSLAIFTDLEGALIGAAGLSIGVVAESIATRLMTSDAIRQLKARCQGETAVTYGEISRLYYPLALTSMLTLGVHPMATFFLGQGRMALESLAAAPVVNSLVFIFRSIGLSYQEVIIALLDEEGKQYYQLRKFAQILALLSVGGLVLVAFTPLSQIWFITVSGLSEVLASVAAVPVKIMFFFPALTVLISFQRAILIRYQQTRSITMATVLEVLGIAAALYLTIIHWGWIGIYGSAAAYLCGRLLANLWLSPPTLKLTRRIRAAN
jgi:progressive ankylosis protein